MSTRTIVVIPTYNEAENILDLTREVLAQDPSLEVLVVDDGSPDGTGDLVEEEQRKERRLHLHRRPAKLGLGSAHLAGFRFGLQNQYDWIATMDGDWSHHPRYLGQILGAMERYDMVVGSRYLPGGGVSNWGIHRRLLSSFANWYTRTLLRLPVRDCTGGYRCYHRKVLETVEPFDIRSSGYSFLEEMVLRVHRAGFGIGEIPIIFEDRLAGRTKIDSSEVFKAAWHVLRNALHPPPMRRQGRPGSTAGPPRPEGVHERLGGSGSTRMTSRCPLCHADSAARLFSKGGRGFVRCTGCGLARVDPLPAPGELSEHYERSYQEGSYSFFAAASNIRFGIARYRLATVQPYTVRGRWLDVGCSGGEFMEVAREAGLEIEGLDLSASAVARARDRGLVAHHSTVEQFAPDRPYDTLTAFDVLEHALDPREAVRRFHEWLAPAGTLILTLPDANSVYPRLLMRRHWFYYLPDEHLFYFNRRTITRLLDEEGFLVRRITRAHKPLTLRYVAASLRRFNPVLGRIASLAVSGLPRRVSSRAWRLYVGEMLVCARRT